MKLSSTLLLTTTLFFTACGGGSSSTSGVNTETEGIDIIKAYADSNSNDAPVLQDYVDAGVTGVTATNLAELNSLVDSLEEEDVDTVEEINALTQTLGVNIVPVANAQSVTVDEDTTANAITLVGSDTDGDSLTYSITKQPTNGTLAGTAPNVTYTPDADYAGADNFSFKVNDGTDDSAVAVVSITVTDVAEPVVNTAPVATAQSVTLDEDTSKAITLAGTDADSDSLTYTVTVAPEHGTLSGTAPAVTYTPEANYFGDDSFSFTVNDGTEDSATAVVSITVNDVAEPVVNAAPVATAQSVTLDEDTSKAITLAGTDANSDSLTYTVTVEPEYGTLSGTAPDLTYTPEANYFGDDSFSFTVNDGTEDSSAAVVSITVTDVAEPVVNAAPVATAQSVRVDQGTATVITLAGTDVDADSLTYAYTQPSNGAVSGEGASVTYTPTAAYVGDDSFTFTVNDGTEDSEEVTVSIFVVNTAIKKTGQTISYEANGTEVTDGTQKDDGFYQKGVDENYTRDADNETVMDNLTGLIWQDNDEVGTVARPWLTTANYDTCDANTSSTACTDTTGETAATYCEALDLADYTDWRLPTRKELEGIVNRGVSPALNSSFENTTGDYYWAATTFVSEPISAWSVQFYLGNQTVGSKNNPNLKIRCVRNK